MYLEELLIYVQLFTIFINRGNLDSMLVIFDFNPYRRERKENKNKKQNKTILYLVTEASTQVHKKNITNEAIIL